MLRKAVLELVQKRGWVAARGGMGMVCEVWNQQLLARKTLGSYPSSTPPKGKPDIP